MTDVSVRLADPADRPTLERLWLLFRHDMSEYSGVLPNPDGTFRSDRLHAALTRADWAPYLLTSDGSPAGLALVRSLAGPTRVLSGFFVVRGVRRTGIGLRAVREVVARHPGPWEVAFQQGNATAVAFWRRVATEIAGEAWTEERRPVPGRPDLPPDTWISFTAPAEAQGGTSSASVSRAPGLHVHGHTSSA
ncbi:GNAT family N-acetyltransferase (plasmid) [Streptomyces atratus]|uniref:Predicted acetyltransferase n=1 Tax=Streptomyces atratus TaxID=1893 RepID=A0A1K2A1W3_STRAR|nr:GNAT family N-acetyltransferase [Streptomyces atratus]SFX80320.1 Predicted acetyltransferase [Streptomyces atratus]